MSLTARGYVQPLTTEHCGSVHYITIGDSRLLTAAGLTRSPIYLIGDAASRCGLSRVGYFIPLNGRRPLNRHPPSIYTTIGPCPRNLSSKFDEFLTGRSQFDSDHPLPLCHRFLRLSFFLRQKIIINNVAFRHILRCFAAVFA